MLLIVLDNCEHVIATAAEVAEELLRQCPGLRLLATSREGLRVGGETIWPVPPLATDDAVELFVARAQAAGAPLGALRRAPRGGRRHLRPPRRAAARDRARRGSHREPSRSQQIASRLNDRFRLLTGGSRTALPRQQTLRAVVDWSYELLFDDEQRVFERLSVFPGGCDLATAEAVCARRDARCRDLADIIQRSSTSRWSSPCRPATSCASRSSRRSPSTAGRSSPNEATRSGSATRWRRTTPTVRRLAAAFVGDSQRAWLTAVDQEQDNLRGALEWAVANDDAETALTIAGGTSWPHWLAGTAIEGKRWLDDAFRCAGEASERTRALALTGRGLIDFQLGMAPGRRRRPGSGARGSSVTATTWSRLRWRTRSTPRSPRARGDIDEGRRRRLDVLDFYGELPDDSFVVAARAYSRAKIGLLDGDLVAGRVRYREALENFSRLDRPMMLSMCLGMVADFDERPGDYAAAIEELDAAIATNDAVGFRGFTGSLLARLGWALLHDGNAARAEVATTAPSRARRLSNTPVMFLALTGLAVLHRLHGATTRPRLPRPKRSSSTSPAVLAGSANRVDPAADVLTGAAVCCAVLAALAAEAGDGRARGADCSGRRSASRQDAGHRCRRSNATTSTEPARRPARCSVPTRFGQLSSSGSRASSDASVAFRP